MGKAASGSQVRVLAVEGEGEQLGDAVVASEEEEQAEMPLCLPTVYQPTLSEYLDHCVTHYPYRAWCRHCLEGRGREFGHETHRGAKDPRACPVVSIDYAFVSDLGRSRHNKVLRRQARELPSYSL